ncbi:MAG: MerR family transcriptional regulator [Bacteroidota bacterium]
MKKEQYLISELAEKTGVSVRTIRYYTEMGLLPAISSKGRYTYYDESYITRINFIQKMKNNFFPLKKIQNLIAPLTLKEMEDIVKQRMPSDFKVNQDESNLDAMSYISDVLESQKKYTSKSGILNDATPGPSRPYRTRPQGNFDRYIKYSIRPGIELHVDERIIRNDPNYVNSKLKSLIQLLS